MTDFGVEWRDGGMLMRATGDVHSVHLGPDDREGYIMRWSRAGGVRTTHMQGTREQVLREWGRLKEFCFRPTADQLRQVSFPEGERCSRT